MSGEYKDLLNRIQSRFKKLSKGQKRIADYILNNYDKVAFMTAASLGQAVDVSESTVVRFANALGYGGYPKLQKALQESIKTKLTTVQRFEMSKELESNSDLYRKIMTQDIENIQRSLDDLDMDNLMNIADEIHKARRVYVLGLRSSAVLAQYLSFYLNFAIDRVNVIPVGVLDPFDSVINLSEEDLLIVITFPRYSNQTLKLAKYVHEKNVPIISITDSVLSPVASMSKHTLTAKYDMMTFIDSLVAPMSVINSLILAVGMKNREFLDHKFKELEKIWEESHTYSDKYEAETKY
ncbi:MurR/RpiR family transcriptional regulator [Acidaminobacter sp. JC074]|uniref:MurR/RpiR family transcriptional regulator n=1 Tax=Acidaminobacter sp. JC074 TaxID=2530199 RepID=UPI001F0E49E0|nr:MurR/RpiR family transcriptional regulator [Acidaminobacter sp. JC074]MCH4888847.1 MurR/RpiR family transcriptional regulator [Acidaminobacter sp. JC074]